MSLPMDNTEYAIWTPNHCGHAPPFWQDGMFWCLRADYLKLYNNEGLPFWNENTEYCVPPEAVNRPHVEAVYRPFDVQAWLAEGQANADKLPAGVVLPEPTDWAMRLAEEFLSRPAYYSEEQELADFIRTHCQPREVRP
jgi:hypothetical protein